MRTLAIILTCLSAVGFILAIISVWAGPVAGISAEGYSRGSTNLALITILLVLLFKAEVKGNEA